MSGPRNELHTRRVDAVRAWTSFVERGDGAEGLVRPEILRSWERSAPAVGHRRRRGPDGRRVRHRLVLERLPAPGRGRAGRVRAASYGGGRRPRRRRDRPRDAHPVDVRRPRDAPQGGDRQLRRRWAVGRHQRRHQRARPGHPQRPAVDGVQRRALRAHRAQLGVLGGAGARPGVRGAARRHRPLHHLGPDPPDRAGHRTRDGPADRDRDARLAAAPRPAGDADRQARRPGST